MAPCMKVSDLGDFYGDEHDTGVVGNQACKAPCT